MYFVLCILSLIIYSWCYSAFFYYLINIKYLPNAKTGIIIYLIIIFILYLVSYFFLQYYFIGIFICSIIAGILGLSTTKKLPYYNPLEDQKLYTMKETLKDLKQTLENAKRDLSTGTTEEELEKLYSENIIDQNHYVEIKTTIEYLNNIVITYPDLILELERSIDNYEKKKK